MILTTEFDCNDKVWSIYQSIKHNWGPCTFCGGEGKVTGKNGSKLICPSCYGTNRILLGNEYHWEVGDLTTIQEIHIKYSNEHDISEEAYLCFDSIVSSGVLYPIDMLWPTKKEAQEECDRRKK